MMHLQIVHDGVDALEVFWNLLIDVAEEVDEVRLATSRVALRPTVPGRLPQGSIDIAFGSASIIDLLFGSLCWSSVHVDGLLARIAFGRDRTHLIDIQDDAVLGLLLPQPFDGPLFSANSGSSRWPNQVSCLRQRKPSSCKMAKMRVFFIPIKRCSFT